jgi:hypothetical protein
LPRGEKVPVTPKVVFEEVKGGGVSLVMPSLKSSPMAHEAEEYPAMSQSTSEIRIVPLAPGQDVLADLLRDGARRLRAQAVEAEVAAWIDDHAHLRDDQGRRQVVRNGHLPERAIPTGIGAVEVQQPRVRDRRPADRREAFPSAILPPYLRKTRSLEGLLPWCTSRGSAPATSPRPSGRSSAPTRSYSALATAVPFLPR